MEEYEMSEYCMKDTPYSTRNQNGVITFFDTADEAIADFIGYEGYRLSIKIEGATIHIHRDELPVIPNAQPGSLAYANPSARNSYEAKVIVEKRN
jgi:hypothetical protein